jgi:DNA-binding response OmpR family regulator
MMTHSVLICSTAAPMDELLRTVLGRDDIECRTASGAVEAITMMLVSKPDLVLIDERLTDAQPLVKAVRANPVTRPVSIVVIGMASVEPTELAFTAAGANAVLRLPADSEWDERLRELLRVPPRRVARLPTLLQFGAPGRASIQTVPGTVLNISERGMLSEADVAVPIGTDVDFKIHMPGKSTPVVGSGQVVRQDTGTRGGVRFYGLEWDGLERVRQFVGARPQK